MLLHARQQIKPTSSFLTLVRHCQTFQSQLEYHVCCEVAAILNEEEISMETLSRRNFLTQASTLTATALVPQLLHPLQSTATAGRTTQINAKGFFTIAKRDGRWWFITPEDKRFFSIGLNHIDSATLRYRENAHIWRDKYGNSMEKWLEQVRVGASTQSAGFRRW